MPNQKILSSDSHIYEPSDLWTSRSTPNSENGLLVSSGRRATTGGIATASRSAVFTLVGHSWV